MHYNFKLCCALEPRLFGHLYNWIMFTSVGGKEVGGRRRVCFFIKPIKIRNFKWWKKISFTNLLKDKNPKSLNNLKTLEILGSQNFKPRKSEN